jgi:hypothetical protein
VTLDRLATDVDVLWRRVRSRLPPPAKSLQTIGPRQPVRKNGIQCEQIELFFPFSS